MRATKLLSSLLVGTVLFSIAMPNVYAQNYTNNDAVNETSNYDIDTRYEAELYVAPIETYNVDVVWNDMHWVFVYEGDITNPTKSLWMTKANYDNGRTINDDNEYNYEILNNISQYANMDTANIEVINNSDFAVNVAASIEQIDNVANYSNPAGLKVSKSNEMSYGDSASIVALSKNANGSFLVKPTAERYVSDSDVTVNVAGEVKLVFTKSN